MKYKIELTRPAVKEFQRLDRATSDRVRDAIDGLADDPRPPGVRKLKAREDEWRIRVGNMRVLYGVDDSARRVTIFRITDRKDVYRS